MNYRREIDGLRAFAVLPVILFHAGFQPFSGGFVGVDVFFVISGYLITSIILAEKQAGTFTLIGFYERRARRILPALFVVMFACLPFAWLWLLSPDMRRFSQSLVAVSGFASNILFWKTSGYFDVASELKPLLHTWSLAVEEQYYLFFPIFLTLTWRLGQRWILSFLAVVAIISLAAAQWGSFSHPNAAFFLLPTRGWEILIGTFIAFYSDGPHRSDRRQLLGQLGSAAGLLLVMYSIFVFDAQTPFPSLYTLAPTIGAGLIILFATPQTFVGKWLGHRLFVGMGLISYSAYLWHQPLFAFARQRSLDEPSRLLLMTLAVVALFLAYFTWKYIEVPFREKQRFNRQQIFRYGVICSSFFITFGLLGHLTRGSFFRIHDASASRINAASDEGGKGQECSALIAKTKNLSNTCQLGISDPVKSFAIIGDSHAGAIVNELDIAAKKAGVSGSDFSYHSCPPLYKGLFEKQDSTQSVCNGVRGDFFTRLTNKNVPTTLILLARWTILMEQERFDNNEGGVESGQPAVWYAPSHESVGYKEALKKSYVESIHMILGMGQRVILVYPVPEMGWDVPTRLGKILRINHEISATDASTSYQVFVNRNSQSYGALDAIGEHKNLVRVKPASIFCDTYLKGRCVGHIDGTPLYYDDDHLSNAGARLVVDEIMKYVSE